LLFSIQPKHVVVLSINIILFKGIKFRSQVDLFCFALARTAYMKHCQQTLFAGFSLTSHQVLTSFAMSSSVILQQLFLSPPLYVVFEDSNSDLLFCGTRILPQCMSNPLPFLHPAYLKRECMFSLNVINVPVHLY
jgi:hypothetical protein